ncbi:hypothetical protein C5098_06935 [Escherichia coli]|nr:hypothetical protein C5098_06935 [Escherichia coli]
MLARLIRPTVGVGAVGRIRRLRRVRHMPDAMLAHLIRPTGGVGTVGRIRRLVNCTPNVGHNLTSEGAVYETFI